MGLSSTENHVNCYLSGFWLLPHDIRVKFIWFQKYPDSSEGAQENKQKKTTTRITTKILFTRYIRTQLNICQLTVLIHPNVHNPSPKQIFSPDECPPPPGGSTPLYKGIVFWPFWFWESCMVFEGTTGMYEQTSNRERERCAFEIDLNFFCLVYALM